ncbi:SLC6A7 [Cordylochernes scorpioides]|uniref:Transporter n=1 Tax=Cordylochernes scorpioides TaxID=51811 RepID=A0ABY6JX11_9ARAC|nr:SLC6A7 [Cordylochernes scorpioides]
MRMCGCVQVPAKPQPDRGTWTNQAEFFLSCLGYAVGLGNVWRFPYLCFRNGGGAFLIPYCIMLAIGGLPLFYMELALGQYHGKGPNIVFKHMAPLFHGLGFAMLMVTLLVSLYYNMIIAWTLFYTFASFTSQLGWEFCGNSWNSVECFNTAQNAECLELNQTFWNNTCVEVAQFCQGVSGFEPLNDTYCRNVTSGAATELQAVVQRVSPSEDYFKNYMLDLSPSLDEFGPVRWQLALCLLLAWVIVLLCLIRGVKSSGKVVYFTALFPYVVLFILLIRGLTLEGFQKGIYFYIVPEWKRLKDPKVWGDAATQIFYSLAPGFGGLLTLSSYNRFNNNCYRDAITVSVANCATSVFAGFVIFSILGFMAETLKVPVTDVVKAGPGLAFIAYPEAVTKMPGSPVWAFLFFFMLITLGLDSQFTMCETIITAFQDQWPSLIKYKSFVTVATCIVCFLLGLPMCTRGGVYIFTLIDWYSASWSLLIIAFLECGLVAWIYGLNRFSSNIKDMIGVSPNIYWKSMWVFITPATLIGILIFLWITYTPASYGDYVFPEWANALGWLMALASVILIPIFAAYEVFKNIRSGEPLSDLLRPTEDWGPVVRNVAKSSKDGAAALEISSYDNPSFTYGTHM